MAKKPGSVSELPDGPVDENGLTPRQTKILLAIKKAMETNGYPPSMREIGEAAGLSSPSSVKYQLEALEEKRLDSSRPISWSRFRSSHSWRRTIRRHYPGENPQRSARWSYRCRWSNPCRTEC